MGEWENTIRPVNLTNGQINTLVCYIHMTTQHRKGEREAWEELAKEVNENGEPVFKNAQSNAHYYQDLETKLKEIVSILDEA